MLAQVKTPLPVEVRGFVLPPSASVSDIMRIQERFGGQLDVVRRHPQGDGLIFSEDPEVQKRLEVFGRFAGLKEQVHYTHQL